MEVWAMPTDEERREVARRLRGLEVCELDGEFIDCGEVEVALGLVSDDGAWYEAEGIMRLADLIEPTDGFDLDHMAQVCFECLEGCDEPEYTLYEMILTAISRYKRGESGLPTAALVDRDALLAWADRLASVGDSNCKGCKLEGLGCVVCTAAVAHESARRIRKALGVEP